MRRLPGLIADPEIAQPGTRGNPMTTAHEPTTSSQATSSLQDPEATREAVRARYAEAAIAVTTAKTAEDAWANSAALSADCCGGDCCADTSQATYGIQLYEPGET